MAVFVFIATSLDGYIADKSGAIEWLTETPNPDGSDFGYGAFFSKIDALVMGRRTFETVLKFGSWPYDKPVFVLSRTLEAAPEHLAGRAEVVCASPDELVGELRERGFGNLYVDGGGVIQSFLEQDLVDEITITRVPILLGGGSPLFASLPRPLEFQLRSTERVSAQLVQDRYMRART